jgi:predicted TPR repeat methyltransferase
MFEGPFTEKSKRIREFFRGFVYRWTLRKFRKCDLTVDLGCGWGTSLSVNKNFWLVDSDRDCIDYLKTRGAKAFCCDLTQELPFPTGFFRNAFTHDVLEHLDNVEMYKLFNETRRVLSTDALFMNVVPNKKGYDFGVVEEVGHKRFVTEVEVQEIAQQTGFEMIRTYRSPFKTDASEYLVHNKLVIVCRAV